MFQNLSSRLGDSLELLSLKSKGFGQRSIGSLSCRSKSSLCVERLVASKLGTIMGWKVFKVDIFAFKLADSFVKIGDEAFEKLLIVGSTLFQGLVG